MSKNDTYMEPEIIHRPNAIIRVHRPILTPEEREFRMKMINDAAASLLVNLEKREKEVSDCEVRNHADVDSGDMAAIG